MKAEFIQIRTSKTEKNQFARKCKQNGTDMSAVARQLIKAYATGQIVLNSHVTEAS